METIACVLCGNSRTRVIGNSIDRKKASPYSFTIEECENCGLTYLNPRPDSDEIVHFYPEDYGPYKAMKSWKPSEQPIIKREIIYTIANLYYSTSPLGSFSRLSSLPGLLRECMKVMMLPIKSRLGPLPQFLPGGRILEIGCGVGSYLDLLIDLGWETYGVEINQKAAEIAREKGHKVITGTLDQTEWPNNYFQAACLWHVLEHLHNPISTLRKLHTLLEPGAELIIEVPNFDSYSSLTFKGDWFGLDTPRHLYFFTAKTLKSVLLETGYHIRSIRSFPSRFVVQRSQFYRDSMPRKRGSFSRVRNKLEEFFLVNMGLVNNRGDLLRIYANRDS